MGSKSRNHKIKKNRNKKALKFLSPLKSKMMKMKKKTSIFPRLSTPQYATQISLRSYAMTSSVSSWRKSMELAS